MSHLAQHLLHPRFLLEAKLVEALSSSLAQGGVLDLLARRFEQCAFDGCGCPRESVQDLDEDASLDDHGVVVGALAGAEGEVDELQRLVQSRQAHLIAIFAHFWAPREGRVGFCLFAVGERAWLLAESAAAFGLEVLLDFLGGAHKDLNYNKSKR